MQLIVFYKVVSAPFGMYARSYLKPFFSPRIFICANINRLFQVSQKSNTHKAVKHATQDLLDEFFYFNHRLHFVFDRFWRWENHQEQEKE
jgi:hypothetical protein